MSRRKRAIVPVPRLFEVEESTLRTTGMARLRELARRSAPRLTEGERLQDENRRVMLKLRRYADELARKFGLRYRAIEAEREGVNEHYGVCYEDGLIKIRLRHATRGSLLKDSSLVDTLCHELAHLRYLDHSERFQRLYRRILEAARRLGYYRPGPQAGRPSQPTLFGAVPCNMAAHRAAKVADDERAV